jgi:glyceraldehyde 3-phosphate dehydrogenase
MTIRVAINGFGRIGRLVFRALYEKNNALELVAVNSTRPPHSDIHLLQFDSVHGRFQEPIDVFDDSIQVRGKRIAFTQTRNPSELTIWKNLDIDVVLECSGAFRDGAEAKIFIQEKLARKVLISAPASAVDATVVMGVNHNLLKPAHEVVSNASCTTNCLAPVLSVLQKNLGIQHGFMTTVHAYTADQRLVDGSHKDLRRARSAALSIIPTTTGAAKSIGLVIPELKGKIEGTSLRVPVGNVSLIDLKLQTLRPTSKLEVNTFFEKASENELKNILGISKLPLVSCDFNHDDRSAIVDLEETCVVDETCVRVLAWYDNEWAYSCRMLDVAVLMGKK